MRRFLLRLLGVEHLLGEITGLAGQVMELQDALSMSEQKRISIQDLTRLLLEPVVSGSCQKIRLRDRCEAEAFGHRVEAGNGAPEGTLEPYRCKICPRQPVSLAHFWHVRHVVARERGKHGAQYHATKPRGLGRISPADLAHIKRRLETK